MLEDLGNCVQIFTQTSFVKQQDGKNGTIYINWGRGGVLSYPETREARAKNPLVDQTLITRLR
jgi:hypothetical protein